MFGTTGDVILGLIGILNRETMCIIRTVGQVIRLSLPFLQSQWRSKLGWCNELTLSK